MTNRLAHRAPRLTIAASTLVTASVLIACTTQSTSYVSAATASPTPPGKNEHRAPAGVGESTSPATAAPFTYAWPVKPFNRQHPVRGFFGDPRISNHGQSKQFHFGIDVSAPNGTPVYATITGPIRIHPLHATTVAIVGSGGVEFSYWHVVPTVRTGQRAIAYKTVIGRIEAPYGHVHFSERRGGRYVNPLRPGAMGPYVDDTRPRVASVRTERIGELALVAETYDETPLAVPRPWHELPVMPALVRWRLVDAKGRSVFGWRTAADFRLTIPQASAFDEVWAPGTMQNHVRAPGTYRIYLSHALTGLRAGAYVVEVMASDSRWNAVIQRFPLAIASALSGS